MGSLQISCRVLRLCSVLYETDWEVNLHQEKPGLKQDINNNNKYNSSLEELSEKYTLTSFHLASLALMEPASYSDLTERL